MNTLIAKATTIAAKLSGWKRLGIVLSTLWLAVSTLLYTKDLARPFSIDERRWHMHITDALGLPRIYGFSSETRSINGRRTPIRIAAFKPVGYASFVLVPIGILWGFGYACAWVKSGFVPPPPPGSDSVSRSK